MVLLLSRCSSLRRHRDYGACQHSERSTQGVTLKGMRGLALLVMTAVAFAVGTPCCVTYDDKSPVALSGERALIIWDSENHKQHFIRQASFMGEAKDFGFIVPTPTKPDVAEADTKVFSTLESLVPPTRSSGAKGMDSAASAGSADLIEQYRVGDYEVSILKASEGKSIIDWLKANNYTNRP